MEEVSKMVTVPKCEEFWSIEQEYRLLKIIWNQFDTLKMMEDTSLEKKNLFIHQIWAFVKEIHDVIEHVHVEDHQQFSIQ